MQSPPVCMRMLLLLWWDSLYPSCLYFFLFFSLLSSFSYRYPSYFPPIWVLLIQLRYESLILFFLIPFLNISLSLPLLLPIPFSTLFSHFFPYFYLSLLLFFIYRRLLVPHRYLFSPISLPSLPPPFFSLSLLLFSHMDE